MKTLAEITAELAGYDPQSVHVTDVVATTCALVADLRADPSNHETVDIGDLTGRVLAQPVISPISVPPHDNSAMDGYAFAYGDWDGERPLRLTVAGQRLAGDTGLAEAPVEAGACVHIMTGAVMPAGADTVVPTELCTREGDTVVINGGGLRAGDNRRFAGEDLQAGGVAVPAGQVMHAAAVGLLASLGINSAVVVRRPRVAYFSTGSEILSFGDAPRSGAVYDSNRWVMLSLLRSWGATPIDMGVIPDDPAQLAAAFTQAAAQADMIISSGGVSVGEADHTKAMMRQLGDVTFWRVAMRPGRPMAVGRVNGCPVFGLPGNPVAVMVTFLAFVRPALQTLAGAEPTPLPMAVARSIEKIRKRPGRTEYQRGVASFDADGSLTVSVLPNQGSGVLSGMVRANCLVVLSHEQPTVEVGDAVTIWWLDRFI